MIQTFCNKISWSALEIKICGSREMMINTEIRSNRRHMGEGSSWSMMSYFLARHGTREGNKPREDLILPRVSFKLFWKLNENGIPLSANYSAHTDLILSIFGLRKYQRGRHNCAFYSFRLWAVKLKLPVKAHMACLCQIKLLETVQTYFASPIHTVMHYHHLRCIFHIGR